MCFSSARVKVGCLAVLVFLYFILFEVRLKHIQALVGTVEELSQSNRTMSLIRDQFETNFFSAVNIIKAILPSMREKKNGHIVVMTGISKPRSKVCFNLRSF